MFGGDHLAFFGGGGDEGAPGQRNKGGDVVERVNLFLFFDFC
jgi:hypothetical protein